MAGQSQASDHRGQTGAELSAIETLPFGSDVLAHNPATGALCLLNASAGVYLALLQAGHSEAAAVRLIAARTGMSGRRIAADFAGLRQAWAEVGLLGAPTPAGPGVATVRADRLGSPACLDATVSCGGPALHLRCDEPALAALLAEVLRPALSAAPVSTLELAGGEGSYQCWLDRRLLWSCGPRPLARRNVLREAIVRTLPGPPAAALLHASAVTVNGRAVVLAGDSGSGKTTLAAALVGAGARFIADDLTPLLPDGALQPVPLALSLKEGSWELLARSFPAVGELPVLESRGLKVRYLWPGAERAVTVPAPPVAILFPAHEPRASPGRERLSPRQTLERLIATGTHLEAVPGALAALAYFAEGTPAFAVRYDSLDDGAAVVGAVLAELHGTGVGP